MPEPAFGSPVFVLCLLHCRTGVKAAISCVLNLNPPDCPLATMQEGDTEDILELKKLCKEVNFNIR